MKHIFKLGMAISQVISFVMLISCTQQADLKPNSSGYVEVNEGKLFYQRFGKGAPMLVLHGGPGLDQSYLLPQMLDLSKDHEVTFYDQRGAGKSLETPMDLAHLNFDQFIKDLDAIRKASGHDKVILVGHSFGGRLAMIYALKYPEHVSQLILLNSAPADHKGQQAFFDELAIRTKPLGDQLAGLSSQELFDKLSAEEIHTLFRKLFAVYFYDTKDADELTLTMSAESAKSGAKVRAIMPYHSSDFDLFPELKNLKVPTLIIHGNADVIPEWTALELKNAIPNSELYIMEKCGHFPYIEKPEKLFSKIRSFEASLK